MLTSPLRFISQHLGLAGLLRLKIDVFCSKSAAPFPARLCYSYITRMLLLLLFLLLLLLLLLLLIVTLVILLEDYSYISLIIYLFIITFVTIFVPVLFLVVLLLLLLPLLFLLLFLPMTAPSAPIWTMPDQCYLTYDTPSCGNALLGCLLIVRCEAPHLSIFGLPSNLTPSWWIRSFGSSTDPVC